MGFEDEYARRNRKRNPITPFLPVLGLFMLVALGAVAFVLSDPVHQFIYEEFFQEEEQQNGTLPEDSFNQDEAQYMVGGGLFVILLMVMGLLYAMFAPKPDKTVTERELKKEKMEMQREAELRKRRKQQMNKQKAMDRQRRLEQEQKK